MSKNIIVLGTAESVGKSLVATALCRYLTNLGKQVAPYKCINVSEKYELIGDRTRIGKGQAIQAEACEINMSSIFNPVFICRNIDKMDKLYMDGESYCDIDSKQDMHLEEELIKCSEVAFDKISNQYETLIIEGEGSCKSLIKNIWDYSNFGIAEYSNADIILVSDMSREDGFISLYGLLTLLDSSKVERIKGIILNKYEGNKTDLQEGINKIENDFSIKIIGVLPKLNFDIEKQTVISERYYGEQKTKLNVSIINLPFIWKKADFFPLESDENISLSYINKAEEISEADIVIIPGTRSVLEDLKYLKSNGFKEELLKHKNKGKLIIGIGGGFQLIGKTLKDEFGVEGNSEKTIKGLDMLPLNTVFTLSRRTMVTKGRVIGEGEVFKSLNDIKVYGYEILNGDIEMDLSAKPFIIDNQNNIIGIINNEETVIGTYLHGIFESSEFREKFFNILKKKSGVVIQDQLAERNYYIKYKRNKYDLLLNEFLGHIDKPLLNNILGIENNEL